MSAPKCSYTIFSNVPYKDKDAFDLKLSDEKIGSVIEYSFVTSSEISINTLNYLQAIQNQAIRLIYNLDWKTSTHASTLNQQSQTNKRTVQPAL